MAVKWPNASARIGKRRSQAECSREGLGRLAVFVSEAEDHALIVPEDGVVFLGRDGPANGLLGQSEVTVVGTLLGQACAEPFLQGIAESVDRPKDGALDLGQRLDLAVFQASHGRSPIG
jgi:hypothetical protein